MSLIQKVFPVFASTLALISCSNITAPPTSELAEATCIPNYKALPTTTPDINRAHIFCGEVKSYIDPTSKIKVYEAKGFHSAAAAPRVSTITGTSNTSSNRGNPINFTPPSTLNFIDTSAFTYELANFNITEGTNSSTKPRSTMFPNRCTAAQVLKSIEYAYNNSAQNKKCTSGQTSPGADVGSCGPSSPKRSDSTYCQVSNAPFDVQVFYNGRLITTSYPLL